MSYAELIEKLRVLPRDKQASVFDFVDFLAARFAAGADASFSHEQWTDVEFSEMSMSHALRGIEDDPVSYSQDDLKERWQ